MSTRAEYCRERCVVRLRLAADYNPVRGDAGDASGDGSTAIISLHPTSCIRFRSVLGLPSRSVYDRVHRTVQRLQTVQTSYKYYIKAFQTAARLDTYQCIRDTVDWTAARASVVSRHS